MAIIIYFILLIIHAIVMTASGLNVGTWQYWVSLFCIIGAHITGREIESRLH